MISGLVSIVVYDGRIGSPTLYHGCKNIGTTEAFIVNMPSEQYDYESPDALDLPYDSPNAPELVPFRW